MKKSYEMFYKEYKYHGIKITCQALLVIIGLIVFLPRNSTAAWPFSSRTSESKEPYLATVGDEIITMSEFNEAVRKLHTSKRVGKALSEQGDFKKQDLALYLDELIDNKLMVQEAESIGLDRERDFIARMYNFKLNLFLGRLRKEEVSDKVKVKESEIEEYYYEQLRKEEEEEKALKDADKQTGEVQEEDKVDKKEEPKKMTPADREAIKKGFINLKSKEREKEYFAKLRRKARVKVDEELLGGISRDKPELMGMAVAYVNGEAITGKEFLGAMGRREPLDLEARRNVLDGLVLHKLLDMEAMSRGYEKDPEFKKLIKSRREKLLIDQFKRKTVAPLVKVEEEEILEYYNANKERFREPDRITLRGIVVGHLEEAESIAEELKNGADFAFLARKESLDPSKRKGGDMGWLSANRFPADTLTVFKGAAEGDILGPFKFQGGYVVFEFHGIEKGPYLPIEKVGDEIFQTIGKARFDTVLKDYLKRLRAVVPVAFNEAELKKLEVK
jgi:peptidyl-prolyl cis-trans isomerase C